MKVLLVPKASGNNFSIEAGLADGLRHFDHHGHFAQPSPCRNECISVIGIDDVVEITHIDADTYIAILRMAGKPLPGIDFFLAEKIDVNGSSVCPDKFNPTLLYMVGVSQIARDLKFPRVTETEQDVTLVIEAMMAKTDDEIVAVGKMATEASETVYVSCRKALDRKVGYWRVGPKDSFDPSRPYEDGIEIVVVQRTHYGTVSIYCSPASTHAFNGQTIAGIAFAGHPKAAGSPRGMEISNYQAWQVFDAVAKKSQEDNGLNI
jgi:hypothetical protein